MGTRRVVIEFLGNDKSASKTARQVETSTSKMGDTFAKVGKTAAVGLAGGVLLGSAAVVKFVKDAEESAKVGRLTDAVIKSTGGSAKITAKQVGDLATAISNKTGADDEAIQSGANLLLTFTNVKNEAGKGNDIFNQATSTITDMTAALNGGAVTSEGLKSSSIQLGKALNDPIKGITALQKVGVSFTQGQKDQIKSMVKAGDTLGAQKIILKELNKEFGGAAAAASSPFEKLKTAAGNLSEQLGGYLLPSVTKVTQYLADHMAPAAARIDQVVRTVAPKIRDFARSFGDWLLPKARAFGDWARANLLPMLGEIASYIGSQVLPKIRQFGSFLVTTLLPVVKRMVSEGLSAAHQAFERVRTAVQNNEPQLRKLATVIGVVVKWVAERLTPVLGFLAGTQMRLVGREISNVIRGIGLFVTAISAVVRAVKSAGGAISSGFTAVKTAAQTALKYVVDKFLDFVGHILNGAAKAFGWVPGLGGKLKTAAASFATFKTNVNKQLAGINDQDVTITAKLNSANIGIKNSKDRRLQGPFATGGKIRGPGGMTDDMVPILASNDEWVIKGKSSQKYGDHAMASINAGTATVIPGFAAGGSPGLHVGTRVPTAGAVSGMAQLARRSLNQISAAFSSAMAKKIGFNPGLEGALNFARSQVGKPYVWGAVGPNGYDCSGFMSALTNIVLGRSPYHRVGATGSFPWSGFAPGFGAFSIGSHRGNPGHMAGTINGVNVESSGGRGVHMGAGARGARDSLFGGNIYHLKGFARGGKVEGDAPFDLLDPRGRAYVARGVPSYKQGTPYVPQNQLAYLHKGEQVIPAGGGDVFGVIRVDLALDGKVMQSKLVQLKRRNGGLPLGLA